MLTWKRIWLPVFVYSWLEKRSAAQRALRSHASSRDSLSFSLFFVPLSLLPFLILLSLSLALFRATVTANEPWTLVSYRAVARIVRDVYRYKTVHRYPLSWISRMYQYNHHNFFFWWKYNPLFELRLKNWGFPKPYWNIKKYLKFILQY